MTFKEQADVCAAFGLGEPLACEPLGGTRNHNFLLSTSNGKFVVRDRYAGYRDPARIAFDHDALAFLHERGVAVVPPIRWISGETFRQHGDRLWEVFPAITGGHFRDGDANDIRALADALAAFHHAGRDFHPPATPQKLGPRGETNPSELFDLVRKLGADAPLAVKRYEDWIISAATDLSDQYFTALPHTLIHGDIQPANILVDAGRVQAFVDLDWCAWRPRIYDIAFAILLCCATHESPIEGGDIWSLTQPPIVQPDLMRIFLSSYDEQEWPLSQTERNALRPQVMLSWCHCRLAGAMKVEPARRREFLDRPPGNASALLPDSIT